MGHEAPEWMETMQVHGNEVKVGMTVSGGAIVVSEVVQEGEVFHISLSSVRQQGVVGIASMKAEHVLNVDEEVAA